MTEDAGRSQFLRQERERWEREGRPPVPCPECEQTRRNPDTLRAHRAIAHGVKS